MRTAVLCMLAVLAVSANVPKPFQSKQSSVYRFDSQVASSLIDVSPNEIQQAAATRMRADVHISFNTDNQAKLQFQHVRMGELNGEMPKSQRVQPLEHFDRRDLDQEVKQQMEMPFSVTYTNGVIEKVNFHEDDSAWSKNIKRAVLNMIQLNLEQNEMHGLRKLNDDEENQDDKNALMFTIPEITLEGECNTLYTIQKSPKYDEENENGLFNVTKTIDFNKCMRTTDLSYGYQPNPAQQLRCSNCIYQQTTQLSAESVESIRYSQCQLECQPNKINDDNDVERSTFARFELMGKREKYAIKRTTMMSQYVVKAQNPASQNALTQVIALNELTFKKQTDDDKMVPDFKKSEKTETLMYSSEWEIKEKRFYMVGDEEFEKNSPFQKVEKTEQKVTHALQSILKQWTNQELGYELDSAINFNRLVIVIRQSSVKQIRNLEDLLHAGAQRENNDDQCWCKTCDKWCEEHAKSLFLDSLAVAATRNSLYVLSEKIVKQEIPTAKAVQCLQTFISNQHSPSEQQADLLEQIVKHEVAHRSKVLKQTALLSFGTAIGAFCQNKPDQSQQEMFHVGKLCSKSKKEEYKKTLIQQFKQADSTYEQILALKAIGNAALDNTVEYLTLIIKEQRQSTLVRMEAIDALRRSRTTEARKIQQSLVPVFQNQREQPEIRMAAFSMIMYTQPDKAVLDQLTFTVITDRSQNVKAFVLSTMETLSQSPNSAEQEVANHMKSSLKMIKISVDQRRPSRKFRVPIYMSGQDNTEEQNVFLGLASIVSPANMIPIHLSASLRSAFAGEATQENVKLSFSQKNLDQLYQKIADFVRSYGQFMNDDKKEMERQSSKDLRSIYSSLGIKSRRSGSYYLSSEDETEMSAEMNQKSGKLISNEPFGMIVIRTNDVDQALVPISEQHLPQIIRKILQQQKPSISDFEELSKKLSTGPRFQQHGVLSVGEKKTKIPTIAGFPLSLIRQTSAIGSVDGQLQFGKSNPESSRELNVELKLRTSGIATHMHKTELWTPVMITGVETLRTIELHSPVEAKLFVDTKKVELTVRPPQLHKIRIFGIHTLPVTFISQFDMNTRNHRDLRVRAIRNWALEQNQNEHQMLEHTDRVIVLDGHFHSFAEPKQLLHAFYTTENNLHVFYNPSQRTPKELKLSVSGFLFQEQAEHGRPEMENFYSSNKGTKLFDVFEGFEINENQEKKLSAYSQQYSSKNAFKHQLKIEIEAKYAQKTHKIMTEMKGACDTQLKHCKINVEAECSPLGLSTQKWNMNSKIQTVAPEIVDRNEKPDQKQSQLFIQMDSEWGVEQKNKLNLRVQAEPTQLMMWKNDQSGAWSHFLNKIDLVAEFQLRQPQMSVIQRLYDLLKAKMFWQLNAEQRSGEEGQIRVSALIDPFTRRHANITILTPHQKLRMDSVRIPASVSSVIVFPLERRSANLRSMADLMEIVSNQRKAECRVDEVRVKTFDGVAYEAPLSSCWSVLAKDCSREEPRFVVLMKKTGIVKKVKIITPENLIELIGQSENEKLIVKLDGKQIGEKDQLSMVGIELNGNKIFVTKHGFSVDFDGQEAKIKIGGEYKNVQCGLCGHYNDENQDVFRMSNNQRSSNLKEFHRSFTLKNEECEESQLNQHYEQKSDEFAVRPSQQRRVWFDNEIYDSNLEKQWLSSSEEIDHKNIKPIDQTEIVEHSHKICFSTQPVKRCPRGSTPDDEAETKSVQAEFFCLERTSIDGNRLQRHARKGKVIDSEGRPVAFTQTVEQPTKCLAF